MPEQTSNVQARRGLGCFSGCFVVFVVLAVIAGAVQAFQEMPVGAVLLAGVVTIVVIASGVSRRRGDRARRASDPEAVVRRDVVARARITPGGGCGWCGSVTPHIDLDGRKALPRVWHRDEIAATLAAARSERET